MAASCSIPPRKPADSAEAARAIAQARFRARSAWLLGIYSAFVLVFFSISTNQEYYTFPAWPALLILIAAVVAETRRGAIPSSFVSGREGIDRVNSTARC